MITLDNSIQIQDGVTAFNKTYYGLSTDSKPSTGIGNGSGFIEMDSGKSYLFDAENSEWIEQSGGSGGGGSNNMVIINDDGTSLDKTFAEIYNLVVSGTPCYISYTADMSVSDLDNDYAYGVALLPIVRVFKYDNAYRIYAAAVTTRDYPGFNYSGIPSLFAYQASTSSSYPTFYKTVYCTSSALDTINIRN